MGSPVAFSHINRAGCKIAILDDPLGSVLVFSLRTQGRFQQTTTCKIIYTTFTRTHNSLALTDFSFPPSSQLRGNKALISLRGGQIPYSIAIFYISALIKSKWQEMNWESLGYSLRSLKINYWESTLLDSFIILFFILFVCLFDSCYATCYVWKCDR